MRHRRLRSATSWFRGAISTGGGERLCGRRPTSPSLAGTAWRLTWETIGTVTARQDGSFEFEDATLSGSRAGFIAPFRRSEPRVVCPSAARWYPT